MSLPSREPETPPPTSKENKADASASKGADTDKPKTVSIKVVDEARNEITFKIKRTKPLEKVIQAYCAAKKNHDTQSVRFLFEGIRIKEHDTADSLEMHNEDSIGVFLFQQGGAD
ncbi:hypothetical protein SBOR_1835 [Sclerotinia borealis F-4128]|uniref:Ubiquitin-like domain-containing protein n=1 Tax=Sclerotinia borealis (strain F-4128) TaxID=1432307 RepID=W9CPS5_SCLBF|nr:hypothetical protein SBOR_1835 [Sclerotinia borealis F-4128]